MKVLQHHFQVDELDAFDHVIFSERDADGASRASRKIRNRSTMETL